MSGKVTCPQAVSRESHRTRNKNKQTGLHSQSCMEATASLCIMIIETKDLSG
jgi:hypothetical protein